MYIKKIAEPVEGLQNQRQSVTSTLDKKNLSMIEYCTPMQCDILHIFTQ